MNRILIKFIYSCTNVWKKREIRRKLKLQSFEALEDLFWCFSLTLCLIARSTSAFYILPNPTRFPLRKSFCYAPTLTTVILLVYLLSIRKRPKKFVVQSFVFLTMPALLPLPPSPPSPLKKMMLYKMYLSLKNFNSFSGGRFSTGLDC